MENRLFTKYQLQLVDFFNSPSGREKLGIARDIPRIGKVSPNSFHFADGNYVKRGKIYVPQVQAEFRSYPIYSKILGSALLSLDALQYKLSSFEEAKKVLPHYMDIEKANFPQFLFSTLTAYADAGGDGNIYVNVGSWATVRGAATGIVENTTLVRVRSSDEGGGNYANYRGFFPFNITSIGANQLISAIIFSLFGFSVTDGGGAIGITLGTQASLTALAAGDYDNIILNSAIEGATRINLSAWSTSGYNDFTGNASMISWADAVKVSGFLDLVPRMSNDIDNTQPGGLAINDGRCFTSNETDTSQDPKVVITYAAITPSNFFNFFHR